MTTFNRTTDKLYVIHDQGALRIVVRRDGKVTEITKHVASKCKWPLRDGNELEVLETVVSLIPTVDEITLTG